MINYHAYGGKLVSKKELIEQRDLLQDMIEKAIKSHNLEREICKERIRELEDELYIFGCEKTIGVMTVEVNMRDTKEIQDAILKQVQERMDESMARLGLDMNWIVMPSIVKSVQTITVPVKKEE